MGNNQLAMQLYNEVAELDKNSVFSPYSLMVAMSMILAGSRGNTSKQLVEALHFDRMEILDIHTSMKRLSDGLYRNANSAMCKFNDANCVFTSKDSQILPSYLKLVGDFYHSDVKEIDFSDRQSAANIVNQWVDKMTDHKIQKLLDANDINPIAKMILINAIYFNGKWRYPFPKEQGDVSDEEFYYNTGKNVTVKMMRRYYMHINYMQDHKAGIQMIELPYKCDKVSMIFILPESIESFSDLKQKVISNGTLDKWIKSMNRDYVNVQIPKFTIKQMIDLNDVFKKLGVTNLFDSNRSDLSGISETTKLYVEKFIQEARLEVNEEGSKAAAASGIVILGDVPNFNANRPFMYVIRDVESNTILFMGHVRRPDHS